MLRLFRLVLSAEIFKAECKSASGARCIKWTQKSHQGREDGNPQHLSTGTFYVWGTGQAPVDTRALLTSALGWELWASAHLTDKQLEAPRAEARAARMDGECGQAAGEVPKHPRLETLGSCRLTAPRQPCGDLSFLLPKLLGAEAAPISPLIATSPLSAFNANAWRWACRILSE